TYISKQANVGQDPSFSPSSYWDSFNNLVSTLSTPVEAVPSIDKATMLSAIPTSPPGSNANFLNDSADIGNDWRRSSWFGNFWKTLNNTWIYHSNLGWLYPEVTDSNSSWFYNVELGWIWTEVSVYPLIYGSAGSSWNYFEATKNRIYNYGSATWGNVQNGANGVIPDWYSVTDSYSVKDLVFSGAETFISQQLNTGQQPASNPSYWKSFNTLAAALSAPVAAVPSIDKTTMLSSLPGTKPSNRVNLWQGHTPLVGEWKNSPWFGTFLELNNTNGWLFHTELNFIYTDSITQSSVWFFNPELGWIWTNQTTYPFLYSNVDSSWNYFDVQSGSIYSFTKNSWSSIQAHQTTGVPQIYSGNNGLIPLMPYGSMVVFNGVNYLNNIPDRFTDPQDFKNWLDLTNELSEKRRPDSSSPGVSPDLSALPGSPPDTSGKRWKGEISLGNNWQRIPWFGTFYESDNLNGNIFHSELGWGKLNRTDSNSTWFLGQGQKYWFSSLVHPFYFVVDSFGNTHWKYFNEEAGTHFDYKSSSWSELKDTNATLSPSSFEPYSSTRSYSQLDRVVYDSNFFIAVDSSQGETPPSNGAFNNFWMPLGMVLMSDPSLQLGSYQPPNNTILVSKPLLPPGYTLYSENYVDRKVAEANETAQNTLTNEKASSRIQGYVEGRESVRANPIEFGLVTKVNYDQALRDANASAQAKLIQEKNTSKNQGIAEGKQLVQSKPNDYNLVSQQQYDKAMQEYPSMESNATPYTVGWYFMPNRGWLFTSHSSYPYIYDENTSAWLYFETGNKKPTFYEYGQKKWFQMTDGE
ncbi:MAG: hypothetical protein HOI70_05610, partial [Opitutae bacterium]|nr:hypothetical protein [Opitutae bacterium]